ncbi:MAG: DUF362 domain-containing protein [Clostridia bacterium]|nr:DUF362 domain-containing protein [Clostridia bacterium]
MDRYAVFKADSYDEELMYDVMKKHFEVHDVKSLVSPDSKVVIKPNLVSDMDAAFCATTDPAFVMAIVKCLRELGVTDITVADCPGGATLLTTDINDLYRHAGLDVLAPYAKLNTDFEARELPTPDGFRNRSFTVLGIIANADLVINAPKLKTHNLTCITAGVKNLFGSVPGLLKPAFHAKYPRISDFSDMLTELALTVKPALTVIDAVDIQERNGPVNGARRRLGVTFSSTDVFGLDKVTADTLGIPCEMISTVVASGRYGLLKEAYETEGDVDFRPDRPVILPEMMRAENGLGRMSARIGVFKDKIERAVFSYYPSFNGKCVRCGKCVLSCPKKALTIVAGTVTLDRQKCIGCFCCNETCSNGAIDIKKSLKKR